jgi:uncharacterized membrane protein YdbT with pleckstrin-like domain
VTPEAGFCHKCGAALADAPAAGLAAQAAPNPLTQAVSGRGPDTPEADAWTGSYSPKAMIGLWVLTGLVAAAAIVVSAIFFQIALIPVAIGIVAVLLIELAYLGYRRMSVRYRLTNHRFFHERGILKRITDRIEVIDIDDVTVEQGFVERMLGVGTLRITSSDRTDPELRLPAIDDVRGVAEKMDDLRRQERMRRGLHIESI